MNDNKKQADKLTPVDGQMTEREINSGILSQIQAERGMKGFPCTNGGARLILSRCLGYKIFPMQQKRLVQSGAIVPGEDQDGSLQWSMENVLDLADHCEKKRMFEPASRHREKFTLNERIRHGIHELEDSATAGVFANLPNQDLVDLMLTIDGERERNVVVCLIRGRLAELTLENAELKNR